MITMAVVTDKHQFDTYIKAISSMHAFPPEPTSL